MNTMNNQMRVGLVLVLIAVTCGSIGMALDFQARRVTSIVTILCALSGIGIMIAGSTRKPAA